MINYRNLLFIPIAMLYMGINLAPDGIGITAFASTNGSVSSVPDFAFPPAIPKASNLSESIPVECMPREGSREACHELLKNLDERFDKGAIISDKDIQFDGHTLQYGYGGNPYVEPKTLKYTKFNVSRTSITYERLLYPYEPPHQMVTLDGGEWSKDTGMIGFRSGMMTLYFAGRKIELGHRQFVYWRHFVTWYEGLNMIYEQK